MEFGGDSIKRGTLTPHPPPWSPLRAAEATNNSQAVPGAVPVLSWLPALPAPVLPPPVVSQGSTSNVVLGLVPRVSSLPLQQRIPVEHWGTQRMKAAAERALAKAWQGCRTLLALAAQTDTTAHNKVVAKYWFPPIASPSVSSQL